MNLRIGDMAQLVERRVRNAKARGSNPLISTKNAKTLLNSGVFRFLYSLFMRGIAWNCVGFRLFYYHKYYQKIIKAR